MSKQNNKGNLKRRRCTSCGQFVGEHHVCAKSIELELQVNEPLGILYKIPDASVSVSPTARTEIHSSLNTLGLMDFLKPTKTAIGNDTVICSMQPVRVTAVLGDGNCLFSSLAVALGLSHECGPIIRNIIVSHMNLISFPPNSLQTSVYSDDFPNQHRVLSCTSVDEYLRESRMAENGVFGSCVEIYSFCQIFKLDVFLYHVPFKSWMIYECSSNVNRKGIFIQQNRNANHFEVITELVSIGPESSSLSQVASINRPPSQSSEINLWSQALQNCEGTETEPASKKSKINSDYTWEEHPDPLAISPFTNSVSTKMKKLSALETLSTNSTNLPNNDCSQILEPPCFDFSPTDSVSGNMHTNGECPNLGGCDCCAKCMRQSTVLYPLKLTRKNKTDLKNRVFGNKLTEPVVALCKLCLLYCTTESYDWYNAWPSVFFSLLSDQDRPVRTQMDILSLLPWELRQHWMTSMHYFPVCVQRCLSRKRIAGKCSVDGTLRLRRFQKLMKTLKQTNIALALDNEPYPNVRCPYGCWCFIEESGWIPANHFINLFERDFTSFQSSSFLHLRGIRSDFLTPFVSLRQFLVATTVRVDEKAGLVVQACSRHSRGSSVQYFHPPSHPSLGRTTVNYEERLSAIAPTLSFISSIKANFASHTYQLLRSVGSYSGMSTVRLKRKTRWDFTSDILYHAEGVACLFREDIKTMIREWLRQGKILDDVASGMLDYVPDKKKVNSCLSQATSIDLQTCLDLTKIVETNEKEYLNNVESLSCYTLVHGNDDYGCSPPPLENRVSIVSWIVQAAACVSPILCRSLVNSSKYSVTLRPLFTLLRKVLLGTARMNTAKVLWLVKKSEQAVSAVIEQTNTDDKPEGTTDCCCFVGARFVSEICDTIQHVPLNKRKNIGSATTEQVSYNTTHAIFTTGSPKNLRNKMKPPLNLIISDNEFELIAVGTKDGSSKGEPRWLVRHGGRFQGFWLIEKSKKFAKKTEGYPTDALETFIRGYWTIAIYQRSRNVELIDLKWKFLSTLTGQGIFICARHTIPLTRDFRNSGFQCRCSRASFLRCPHLQCYSSVCKRHFNEGLQQQHRRILIDSVPLEKLNKTNSPSLVSESSSSRDFIEPNSMPANEPIQPDAAAETLDIASSNSSSVSYIVHPETNVEEFEDDNLRIMATLKTNPDEKLISVDLERKEDAFKLPLHILLNSQCNLLYRRNGNPISLSLKEKRFLENISAVSTSALPLIQPEALLFPSIFWCQASSGSFPGAIPTALYNSSNYNKQLGFAGLDDMLRTRIKDGSLLTSCNPTYLQYVFDCLLNMQLHKSDIRIILNRGWQEVNSVPHKCSFLSTQTFKFDCAESRKNVCELAALIRDKNPTYFVTYTCSQSTHPGIRKIFEALHEMYPAETTPKEVLSAAIQAELMPMLRSWYRASQYVMEWVKNSPEEPLGPVSHIWMRYEWQEETAGFPHLHAILCTPEDKFSDDVRSRVCCSKQTFLGGLEVSCPELNAVERFQLGELYQKYQTHNCSKGRKRCHKKTDRLDKPICRVPKYPPSNCFSFKEIPVNFSCETMELLREMDLADIDENSLFPKVKDPLTAGKHHYPTVSNEHYSPTNAALFALTQSSTNVQICDDYMAPRYVAKYAAGVESRAVAKIVAGETENSVKVLTEPIAHEKIAGVQASQKKLRGDEKQKSVTGRVVSITECLWWSLQLPYVCTNVDFVHVPTVPKEFRSGIVTEKRFSNNVKLGATFMEGIRVRKHVLQLPKHRQFTRTQIFLLADVETSSISPDKVTVFGLRPPELLFVSKLKNYYSWFVRCKPQTKKSISNHEVFLKRNLRRSCWVDALGYLVKLRPGSVDAFVNFCRTNGSDGRDGILKREMRIHIVPLLVTKKASQFVAHWKQLSEEDAVVVFSNILPNNPTKFLLHVLLTNGEFDTELDILNVQSFKEAFTKAKIIPSCNINAKTVQNLTRNYLLEQLRFVPGSSKLIDKYLLMAHSVLSEALLVNSLYFAAALPPVLDRSVIEEYEETLAVQISMEKCKMVAFLHTCQKQLPTEQAMLDATITVPLPWKPVIHKSPDQCRNSYTEQKRVLDKLLSSIDIYKEGLCTFIRHQIVFGPPGSGKTFVVLKSLAYALCQGLNCVVTSLAAERSAALAGRHLNALIPFPVEKHASAESLSRTALSNLQRSPIKSRFLQNLHVLFVEELSMISSELWAATDYVLQVITGNYVPFGGKLVIATGDFFQLPPPSGSCLMSSSFPLTTFTFLKLENFVRMQNKNGQELLSLMSATPKTDGNARRIWEIIDKGCNFVHSWKDVPNDRIRIFATRQAERKAIEDKIIDVKNSGTQFYENAAIDEMCVSSTDNWTEASPSTSKFLNKKCLEPQSLFLYPGAILRLTVNMPSISAYQGQLCVLLSLDTIENGSVTIALAPAGCRSIPPLAVIKNKWRCLVIGKETGVTYRFNHKTVCRRIQFPLKLFVASTIHKTMGETLPMVATQIVGSKDFALWLPEQLYVVMSRVRSLNQVTFVGSKESNKRAVLDLVCKKSQWAELTNEILTKSSAGDPTIDHARASPFPPSMRELPVQNLGFCYLLQSEPQQHLLYIGSTMSLVRRLREHNAGLGSAFTKVQNRLPWMVCAYVTGFNWTNASERIRAFEKEWLNAASYYVNAKKKMCHFPQLSIWGKLSQKIGYTKKTI